MKKNLRATLQAKTTTSNGEVHGIANSLTTSRDGTHVLQIAGENVEGKKVPLLLSHDWDALPVGAATMGKVDEEGLHFDGEIFQTVENRNQILEGIKAGVLAVSIGFIIQDMDDEGNVSAMDLLELSITPVPADSKATITQELKIEDNEGQEMEDDKNKKTEAEPTLQDVLDALAKLAEDVSAIKEATVKPDDNSEPEPEPDETNAEKLDKAGALMLELTQDVVKKYDIREMIKELKGAL